MTPTKEQRETILKKIDTTVSEKYYSPAFDQSAWQAIVQRHRDSIVNASSTAAFESAIQKMLVDLSPKGLGLLSEHTPITSRNATRALPSRLLRASGAGYFKTFSQVELQTPQEYGQAMFCWPFQVNQ
jgi:hypothetical protein